MADPRTSTVEEVDPLLFEFTLMTLASVPARRKDVPVAVVCAQAYAEWIGIDAEPGEDAMTDADVLTIAALAKRLSALADLLGAGLYRADMNDDAERLRVVAAASSARLFETSGKPAFQFLEFMATLGRVRAER